MKQKIDLEHAPRLKRSALQIQTRNGGMALFAGILFIGIGVAIAMLVPTDATAQDALPLPDDFPQGVTIPVLVGGVFAFFGLLGCGLGIKGMLYKARLNSKLQLYPNQPWMGDYNWNSAGVVVSSLPKAIGLFVGSLVWCGFLCVFPLFLLVGVVMACFGLYHLLRCFKYGKSYLNFCRFPFFLGEQLTVEFDCPRGISQYDSLTATLLCIQERIETIGKGNNRTTKSICYELFRNEQIFEDGNIMGGPVLPKPITFDLPANGYECDLKTQPPRYWILDITAKTPGVDFGESYLLPVYEKK